jgi:quercetin dioxygenase-like cupin family protein
MILKATAAQTSGRIFVMEQHVPRHVHAPGRHVHENDDQSWFVIDGRGRWFVGDDVFEAGRGDFVHGPHGIPHAFSADTDDLHVLVITAPAGVDATEPTHPPADLPEPPEDPDLAERFGLTALGPETRWTPR